MRTSFSAEIIEDAMRAHCKGMEVSYVDFEMPDEDLRDKAAQFVGRDDQGGAGEFKGSDRGKTLKKGFPRHPVESQQRALRLRRLIGRTVTFVSNGRHGKRTGRVMDVLLKHGQAVAIYTRVEGRRIAIQPSTITI